MKRKPKPKFRVGQYVMFKTVVKGLGLEPYARRVYRRWFVPIAREWRYDIAGTYSPGGHEEKTFRRITKREAGL